MRVLGSKELVTEVQGQGLCIGCGACVELCPYFQNHRGRTVQLFPCELEQGRCYASCPKAEVDLDELAHRYWNEPYQGAAIGKLEKAVAARAGDAMISGPYQGGGTVSALMIQALTSGLITAAVLTGQEKGDPRPVIAETPEVIVSCALSKFGAAPTLAALNRASSAGRRKLGVVGTPCQVTGIAKMRSNLLGMEDFEDPVSLVIGLFCNWALDQRALRAFLARSVNISRIRSMDIPPPPANKLVVVLDDETIEFPLDEIRALILQTCGLCPDMTSEWADLSVGMLEGRPGWNTLLVRNETGDRLVESAVAAGLLEIETLPDSALEHLRQAAGNKKHRAFREVDRRGMLNPDQEELHALMRVSQKIKDEMTGE